MDLFGLLRIEDFEDIQKWVLKVENFSQIRNHRLSTLYSFDFYSETSMKPGRFIWSPEEKPYPEESSTEIQTEDYSKFLNVNIIRG
jgi:hypothetical protein